MSLHKIGWGDTLRLTCRLGQASGATWSSMHVAPGTCVRRHIRSAMSPLKSSSSDMRGLGCRPSHGSGVTCSRGNVAPHTWEVRHRSVAVSLEQGNIPPLAWHARRHTGAPGATTTRERVALGSRSRSSVTALSGFLRRIHRGGGVRRATTRRRGRGTTARTGRAVALATGRGTVRPRTRSLGR